MWAITRNRSQPVVWNIRLLASVFPIYLRYQVFRNPVGSLSQSVSSLGTPVMINRRKCLLLVKSYVSFIVVFEHFSFYLASLVLHCIIIIFSCQMNMNTELLTLHKILSSQRSRCILKQGTIFQVAFIPHCNAAAFTGILVYRCISITAGQRSVTHLNFTSFQCPNAGVGAEMEI